MSKKVLMFGWEFPPYNTGGLGVACENIVENLINLGVKVDLVLPKKVSLFKENVNFYFADQEEFEDIEIAKKYYNGYQTEYSYIEIIKTLKTKTIPLGKSLYDEIIKYAILAEKISEKLDFEIIHCHDWLTILAGIKAKEISQKPLVFHIHATEYERTGGSCNPLIFDIEKHGLEKADKIIAVSNLTKQVLIEKYQISSDKIEVVHNGINFEKEEKLHNHQDYENIYKLKQNGKKIVLYTGRLTYQKGIEYLLNAFKLASIYDKNLMLVICGSGDMENWVIEESAKLKISDKVIFTGFLRGNDLKAIYKLADLYVMPSRFEPFGLVALEALVHQTPVIISKNSGVAEVLNNALKVDYWDVEEMANLIVATLNYTSLHQQLQHFGHQEVKTKSWLESAKKLVSLYKSILD